MNKTSLSILLVFLVRGVFSAVKPPCRATEGYYYDKKLGRCRRCIPCTKVMGIGFGRNLSEQISFHPTFGHTQCLSCRKCPDGYYNNGSYDECKECDVDCKKKHREEYSPCNYRSFAQCGKCLDGFYDPYSNKEYDCEPLPEVLLRTQDAHTEPTTTRFLESSVKHSNNSGGIFLTALIAIVSLVAVALIALLVLQVGPWVIRKIRSICCYQADSPGSSSESMVKSPVNSKSEVNHRVIDLSSSSLEEDSGESTSGSSNESMVKSPVISPSELKHGLEAVVDLSSPKPDEDGDRELNAEQQPLLRPCRRELDSAKVFCEPGNQQQEVPQQKPPKETVQTNQVVTPGHLNFISSQMDGDGDWKRLFVEIEMPPHLVSQLKVEWEMRDTWDFKDFIYRVLERWKQVKAKDATFGNLYRAIVAVNYTGLSSKIDEKYNVVEPCRVEVHR